MQYQSVRKTEVDLQELFMKLRRHDFNRYAHSVMVAELAISILKNCNYPLTEEKYIDIRNAGLLHDIGYVTEFAKTGYHPLDGYNELVSQGWSEEVALVVREHSFADFMSNLFSEEVKEVYRNRPKINSLWVKIMIEVVTLADFHTKYTGEYLPFEDKFRRTKERYPNHPSSIYTLENKFDEVHKLIKKYKFNINDYLK